MGDILVGNLAGSLWARKKVAVDLRPNPNGNGILRRVTVRLRKSMLLWQQKSGGFDWKGGAIGQK